MADLEYRVENGVGTILLNRPEKKNAFTLEMLHLWAEIYREARTDDDVGAIVLIPFRFVDGIMKAWQRYSTHR
jgi:enoyl-CoA hydratase/carnithine racemase